MQLNGGIEDRFNELRGSAKDSVSTYVRSSKDILPPDTSISEPGARSHLLDAVLGTSQQQHSTSVKQLYHG